MNLIKVFFEMRQKFLTVIVSFGVGYALICGFMFLAQERLTFMPELAALHGPQVFPEAHFTEISLTTKDGTTLHGIRTAPLKEAPYVVYFGGNAQNIINFGQFLRRALPDVNLVAFNYRGYGKSEGEPTKKHLMRDVNAKALWIRDNLPPRPIYSLGLSIGTGPATKYAQLVNAEGLMLIMPYDNLAKVGADAYPWLPVRALFRHNIRTDEYMEKYSGPVAMLVAADDNLIHPARSRALSRHAENLLMYDEVPGQNHNSLINSDILMNWLPNALTNLEHAQVKQPRQSP